MSKSKGDRAEREAEALYQRLGFRTHKPQAGRWGDTDLFNEFDILAVPPQGSTAKVRLSQVKSNEARGVESWSQTALTFCSGSVSVDMLVRHDGTNQHDPPTWRLIRPTSTATPPYRICVDERKRDGVAEGDGIVAWLEANVKGLES